MQYILKAPDNLKTDVKLPASKSIGNRALVINALAGGTTMPENLSDCDDTAVMLRALRDMPYEIDIKAAGTAMRFMTAYLAATPGEHVITGTERMRHRPIAVLVVRISITLAKRAIHHSVSRAGSSTVVNSTSRVMSVRSISQRCL